MQINKAIRMGKLRKETCFKSANTEDLKLTFI